jgi:hypothetical protein
MPVLPNFAELAAVPEPPLDMLALALATEFREIDAVAATAALGGLGAELLHEVERTDGSAAELSRDCSQLLGVTHGFAGS